MKKLQYIAAPPAVFQTGDGKYEFEAHGDPVEVTEETAKFLDENYAGLFREVDEKATTQEERILTTPVHEPGGEVRHVDEAGRKHLAPVRETKEVKE